MILEKDKKHIYAQIVHASQKDYVHYGFYSSKSKLALINHLLDVSQPLDILTNSSVCLNLDYGLLDETIKKTILQS